MTADDAAPARDFSEIEAMTPRERVPLLSAPDVIVGRDRANPAAEKLVHGHAYLQRIVDAGGPMDASILTVALDVDGDEPERLRAMVLVAHAAVEADGGDDQAPS